MKQLPKKLYLIDHGYHSYQTPQGSYTENFKNVFISETNNNDTPDYWMDCRVNKETESVDMQLATIMTNSLEMASIGIDICAWIVELEVTHGIEDDKIADLVKKFRTLARPKI
jgi:hypothetical protein